MARTLRGAGFFESSNNFYQRVAKHSALKSDAATRETVYADMAKNWLELQNGKQASELLEKALKEFPKSERKADLMVALGRAYALDEKAEKARKSLTSVISEFPDSKAAAEAQTLLSSL